MNSITLWYNYIIISEINKSNNKKSYEATLTNIEKHMCQNKLF